MKVVIENEKRKKELGCKPRNKHHVDSSEREVMSQRNPGVETRIQRDSIIKKSETDDREAKAYSILEKKAKLYDKLSTLE